MGFFSSLFEGGGKLGKNLIDASKSGTAENVKSLLAQGADTNTRDKHGWTPLMHASWHGRSEMAELLLAQGADPNVKGRRVAYHAAGARGDRRGPSRATCPGEGRHRP